jgi:hypothetical protein
LIARVESFVMCSYPCPSVSICGLFLTLWWKNERREKQRQKNRGQKNLTTKDTKQTKAHGVNSPLSPLCSLWLNSIREQEFQPQRAQRSQRKSSRRWYLWLSFLSSQAARLECRTGNFLVPDILVICRSYLSARICVIRGSPSSSCMRTFDARLAVLWV